VVKAEAIPAEPRSGGPESGLESEIDFVYRALRRFGVQGADLEDLTQEVFLVMWRRRAAFEAGRPLKPWLVGIAFRVASDHRRRGWRREVPSGLVDREDEGSRADEEISSTHSRALARRALATLPEKQRSILLMHELERLPMHDIARALDEPLTTLYSRLVTARRSFARAVRRLEKGLGAHAVAPEALLAIEQTIEAPPPDTRARIAERLRAIALAPPRALPLAPVGMLAVAGLVVAAAIAVVPSGRPLSPGSPAPRNGEALIGRWPFDDRGDSARDLSGNGADCRIHGSAGWVSGRSGGAIDVTSGWLSCAAPFGRRPDLTVAAWVKRGAHQRGMRVLAGRQLGSAERDHFFFGFVDDDLAFTSHVWNGPLRSPLPAAYERWVHVAAVHADGVVKLFVDGALVAERRSYPGRTVDTSTPLVIGAGVNGPDPAVTTQRLAAAIDELRVYGRALGDAEIAALAR
jgi:RNA polymerase sigma-70 factor (ECF subfamily)